MQLIKRFAKQLGFVVLISSSMVSASSVTAQEALITTFIDTNQDVIIDSALLQGQFPNSTELNLIKIGGIHFSDLDDFSIETVAGEKRCDPFGNCTPYGNNRDVGGSDFITSYSPRDGGSRVDGTYSAKESNPPLTFGLFSTTSNPPALHLGDSSHYGTCNFSSCVQFHYGYHIKVTSYGTLDPKFVKSFYQVRTLKGDRDFSTRDALASPQVNLNPPGSGVIPQNAPTEYLVVYSEQRNPAKPNTVIVTWTEFPVKSGQTPTLRFTNSNLNSNSVTIANTKILRSATHIPLQQLNATSLPPIDPNFLAVKDADGTVAPGEIKPPVKLPLPPLASTKKAMTWIINTVVSYSGKTYVQARYDKYTDVYSGDTSVSQARSLLCIRKPAELVNNPIPNFTQSVSTPGGAEKNSWSGGEVFAIPNVVGSSLLSSADADAKCQTAGQNRYGLSGFRMAEFHDGSAPNAGWGFWAQSDDPNLIISSNRYWVKINDQNANPW